MENSSEKVYNNLDEKERGRENEKRNNKNEKRGRRKKVFDMLREDGNDKIFDR